MSFGTKLFYKAARALDDSCRLAAALVADIGDTHAASWLMTSAVLLAAVLAVSDQSRDSGRCLSARAA
jgi:hypothetical protein